MSANPPIIPKSVGSTYEPIEVSKVCVDVGAEKNCKQTAHLHFLEICKQNSFQKYCYIATFLKFRDIQIRFMNLCDCNFPSDIWNLEKSNFCD